MKITQSVRLTCCQRAAAWATFLSGVIWLVLVPGPTLAQTPPKQMQPSNLEEKKAPPKPRDKEAAALILHHLRRYAADARNKTDVDFRVEKRVGKDPKTRAAALRLIKNLDRSPDFARQAVMGDQADLPLETSFPQERYREVFGRLAKYGNRAIKEPEGIEDKGWSRPKTPKDKGTESPGYDRESGKPLPDEQPPFRRWLERAPWPRAGLFTGWRLLPALYQEDRYQLYYNGMWARYETYNDHGSDSDEIYLLATIAESDGDSITVRMPSRNDPPYYVDVDGGGTRPRSGQIRRIWGGPDGKQAQDLSVTVWAWEQDSGDPEERRMATDLTWKTAEGVCAFIGEAHPLFCVLALVAAGVIEGAVAILSGGDDDLVGEAQVRAVSAGTMRDWVAGGLRTWGREPFPGHFRTVHRGSGNADGAEYRVYFAFHSPLALE